MFDFYEIGFQILNGLKQRERIKTFKPKRVIL